MNLHSVWSSLETFFEPLNEDAYQAWLKIAADNAYPPGWGTWMAAGFLFAGEAFSTPAYLRVFPYGAERVIKARLDAAVEQGILTALLDNFYQATPKGREAVRQLIQAAEDLLARKYSAPHTGLMQINMYLQRICQASLTFPEPPPVFGASHYFENMHPGESALPIRLFVHYFGTLDKYRGNAHLVSWKHYGIEGNRWEVLSEIWLGKNNSLDLIYEELQGRGISRDEYAAILQELKGRGWIAEDTGIYRMTEIGQQIRDESEALTDRYFFAPWTCLSESELVDLTNLAIQLRVDLKNLKR